MEFWKQISALVYYTGAGLTLIGVAIRFLYRFFHKHDQNVAFLNELKEVHLVNIYSALEQIAEKLHINLKYTRPQFPS